MRLHPFDLKRRLIAHAYRNKKFEKVQSLSKKYLLKYPDDCKIIELLARSYVSTKQWSLAFPLYKHLFSIDPNYRDVCIQFAKCSIYQKEWQDIKLITNNSSNVLGDNKLQKVLTKKILSLTDDEFIEFIEQSESFMESLPDSALHRWANVNRIGRLNKIFPIDLHCKSRMIGGPFFGQLLVDELEKSQEKARELVEKYIEIYETIELAKWISSEFSSHQELMRPVVNWLLELTSKEKINQLYDQFAAYIPMEEFVDLNQLDTLASSVDTAHLWLVETLMLHQNNIAINKLIMRNLPNTCYAIETTLQRNIVKCRHEDTVWLLEQICNNNELLSINSIRRMIAKSLLSVGAMELAYYFALETVDYFPQDGVSAFVALNSAIELVDDKKILHAADINLNLRSPNPNINHAAIIAACLRNGKEELARDAMERFRMKMDGAGHRLRVGYQFNHLNDWGGTIEALNSTPEDYVNHPNLVLMGGAAHAMLGQIEQSISLCENIPISVERICSNYAMFHINENYEQAFQELNNQFISDYNVGLSPHWLDNNLNYMSIESIQPEKIATGPLISVIMTIHKWNDAFPLAINSILNQSYSNIELLLIDDASPLRDVKRYKPFIKDSRITYHRVEENQGTYACRNDGIKIAQGEYITFADSDDWNHPCRVEYALNEIIDNNAFMTHGRYIRMKNDGSVSIDGGRPARFSLVSMFWNAKILRDVFQGFDNNVRFSGDSELYERARSLYGTKKIIRNNRIEVIALHHDASLTASGISKIDWTGPGKSRLTYVSRYRRWHEIMVNKHNLNSTTSSHKSPPQNNIDIDYNNKLVSHIEQVFQFVETHDNQQNAKPLNSNLDEISIGMATYSGGFSTLVKAVTSLLNQSVEATRICIYVNGDQAPPKLPSDPRISIVQGMDITDIGKFKAIDGYMGYLFTVDDDIEYPYDYIEKMIREIEENNRTHLIGVHGAIMPAGPPLSRWSTYSEMRRTHVFETSSITNFPVNVIGTGTLGFHSDIGLIPWEQFDYNRMVDLHLASWAQNNNHPMKIISRPRRWLEEINSELDGRIWQTANINKNLQWEMLDVLQRSTKWQIHGKTHELIKCDNLEQWKCRELPPGFELPDLPPPYPQIIDPKVTIYIPLYNSRDYIEETINSALNQTYTDIEVCIHDDGSTDGSFQLISTLFGNNSKVNISSSDNGGIGSASNKAISLGSGELILQLDSDDIIEPNTVELLVNEFSNNPEIICCYGNFNRINHSGDAIDDGWENINYSRERILRSMIIHHPRMFRKDSFEAINGFNEELINAVDYDFFLRLSMQGAMSHLRETLYSYRIHELSTSQAQTKKQDKNTLVVQRNMLEILGVKGKFSPYANNPDFPRRINYVYNWTLLETSKNDANVDISHEELIELGSKSPSKEHNAIEISGLDLYFPRSKKLVRGMLNLLKSNGKNGINQFQALDKINLEVKQGEVLGVIGRNGSGKSTMVRVMAGIYRPDGGTVRVRGRTTLLAGVSVGLNPNLTGIENVHLYGSILGHDKEIMDEMMDEIIDFSELGEFIKQPLRTYSSGMRARLGLAIASAIEPEVLLIDEVLGVGDQQFKEKSKKRILDLVKSTGTVVIVSHSFGLMTEICDRIVLIHNGHVADIGEPQKVIGTYYKLTN